jgi:nitrogen regulatory protein PII
MAKETIRSRLFSGLRVKLPGVKQETVTIPASITPEMKLLFCIIDWNKSHVISDIFVEEKVRFHFISKASGTARNDVLDLLGIGASEKAMIICLEQAVMIPVLLKEVQKKLGFYRPGTGIAFTVPLSAINDPVLLIFKQSIHKNEKISAELEQKLRRGENMAGESSNSIKHDLIVAVINQGYSDQFMNTARDAGASGGTILNARGQAHEGAVKFFGISVQDEKEMIIILTTREKKIPIMQAVCEAHGLNSDAKGIVFSLPVENVLGLNSE